MVIEEFGQESLSKVIENFVTLLDETYNKGIPLQSKMKNSDSEWVDISLNEDYEWDVLNNYYRIKE